MTGHSAKRRVRGDWWPRQQKASEQRKAEAIEAGAQALREAFPTLREDCHTPEWFAKPPGLSWRPPMSSEPTEMAGVAEAETQAAYAWAVDHDDADEFPTQRLTYTAFRPGPGTDSHRCLPTPGRTNRA